MEVNLPVALLVPLYATPSSTPDALNIVFQGDKSLGNAISLSFLSLKGMESIMPSSGHALLFAY